MHVVHVDEAKHTSNARSELIEEQDHDELEGKTEFLFEPYLVGYYDEEATDNCQAYERQFDNRWYAVCR